MVLAAHTLRSPPESPLAGCLRLVLYALAGMTTELLQQVQQSPCFTGWALFLSSSLMNPLPQMTQLSSLLWFRLFFVSFSDIKNPLDLNLLGTSSVLVANPADAYWRFGSWLLDACDQIRSSPESPLAGCFALDPFPLRFRQGSPFRLGWLPCSDRPLFDKAIQCLIGNL